MTITFTVAVAEKHHRQMRQAAEMLTDAESSIQILQYADEPKKLTAQFSVPTARQADVVDEIGRRFWDFVEDYADSSIGFSSESLRRRSGGRRRS